MLPHEQHLLEQGIVPRSPFHQVVVWMDPHNPNLFWVTAIDRRGREMLPRRRVQSRIRAEVFANYLATKMGGWQVVWKEISPRMQKSEAFGSAGIDGRGDGTSIGTGAVHWPDPIQHVKIWADRTPRSTRNRAAWAEYATRLGMSMDDIEKGWQTMAQDAPVPEAVQTLQKFFGEAGGGMSPNPLVGYWLPNIGLVKMQQGTTGSGKDSLGFPFSTAQAERLFDYCLKVVDQYPKMKALAVLQKSLDDSGIPGLDVTPEDLKLLELAIGWAQAGMSNKVPITAPVRTGGAPGGPFRQSGNWGAP